MSGRERLLAKRTLSHSFLGDRVHEHNDGAEAQGPANTLVLLATGLDLLPSQPYSRSKSSACQPASPGKALSERSLCRPAYVHASAASFVRTVYTLYVHSEHVLAVRACVPSQPQPRRLLLLLLLLPRKPPSSGSRNLSRRPSFFARMHALPIAPTHSLRRRTARTKPTNTYSHEVCVARPNYTHTHIAVHTLAVYTRCRILVRTLARFTSSLAVGQQMCIA